VTVLDARPAEADLVFIQADATDIDALRRAFAGQEAVIHLAAIPNPRTAPADVIFRTTPSSVSTTTRRTGSRSISRSTGTIRFVRPSSTR